MKNIDQRDFESEAGNQIEVGGGVECTPPKGVGGMMTPEPTTRSVDHQAFQLINLLLIYFFYFKLSG